MRRFVSREDIDCRGTCAPRMPCRWIARLILTTREAIILSSADRPWGRGLIPLANIVRSDMNGKGTESQSVNIDNLRQGTADLEAFVRKLDEFRQSQEEESLTQNERVEKEQTSTNAR
jgi:hypothetical protein